MSDALDNQAARCREELDAAERRLIDAINRNDCDDIAKYSDEVEYYAVAMCIFAYSFAGRDENEY